jgi:hypothetical protein
MTPEQRPTALAGEGCWRWTRTRTRILPTTHVLTHHPNGVTDGAERRGAGSVG